MAEDNGIYPEPPAPKPWHTQLANFIGRVIGRGIFTFVDLMDLPIKAVMRPYIERVLEVEELPSELRAMLESYLAEGIVPFAAMGMGAASSAGSATLFSFLTPGLEAIKQDVSKKDRWQLLPLESALRLWLRGDITEEQVTEVFEKLGFHDWQIAELKKLRFIRLDPDTISRVWLRDKATYEPFWKDLSDQGWDTNRIDIVKELAHIVPPVGDMVRFADFGSFDPEIIEMWREFYDAPGWIKEPMSKAGIIEDWANKYWFSHWQQPGRYELGLMRHRDLIDDETVKKAYLTQGYTTFWQDHLLELTKELYTRVDIRRMYKVGVLDRDGVYKANRALGYDHEKASNLTEFTLKYYARPEDAVEDEEEKIRELTRADVCDGYRRAILTAAECTELLGKLAYEPASVQFYLDREDLKRDQALKDAYAANYRRLYVIGIKDDATAKSEMVELGYLDTEVDELLKLWYIEKIRREARPSRTDLNRFLKKEIITEGTWHLEMAGLGYDDKYIEWYLQDTKA